MSGIPSNSAIAAVVSDKPAKPVTPADIIPAAPAQALDPLTVTEPTFLDKAKETILPVRDFYPLAYW